MAGAKYRGEFEERLEAVVKEASERGAHRSLGEEREPKPILFIDEIHLLLGAGSASGSVDAANILKPALARGAIRVIGATTTREYRQTIEKDGALERRFQMLRVEEPSADEAVAILLALRPRLKVGEPSPSIPPFASKVFPMACGGLAQSPGPPRPANRQGNAGEIPREHQAMRRDVANRPCPPRPCSHPSPR